MIWMEHGKIIKKLRRERGISQRQLSDGIVARVTLTDFENKNTNISFQTLLLYLNRMNIRIDEFFLLYASDEVQHVEKRKASEYFAQCTQNGVPEVLKGIAYFQRKYQETEDTFYYFLVINLRIFLLSENVLSIDTLTDEISFLMKYFEKIETWGRFEIAMFTNCLAVFPEIFIFLQHNKVVEKLTILSKDLLFQKDIAIYANNLIICSLSNGWPYLFECGWNLLKEIADSDEKNVFERLSCDYFAELFKSCPSKERIDEIISIMNLVGLNHMANEFIDLYQLLFLG